MDPRFLFIIVGKIFFLFFLNNTLYYNKKFDLPVLTTYIEDFYLRKYPELDSVFENKRKELYKYFYNSGIKDGQSASPAFDVKYYLQNNEDIKNTIGEFNFTGAYEHFMQFGKYEGRDLSPVFNLKYYISNNPDVANAFGNNVDAIIDHFLRHGMDEGRASSPNFSLNAYKARNEDIRNAFGDNKREYYYHYCIFGRLEGRPSLFENLDIFNCS